MSYDIRWCVETVMPDVEGDCHAVVHTPRLDSPTYNYSRMFRACMDWDYKQGEMDEDGNYHCAYYPMVEVVPKLKRGLQELREHPESYRQYEPENGWGTLPGAIKCIESWLYELGKDNWDAVTNYWPIEALWWRW